MKKIVQIQKQGLKEKQKITNNFWIQLLSPTKEEINEIAKEMQIKLTDVEKVLDKSELPHIIQEENYTLVIFHTPLKIENTTKYKYKTCPYTIFFFNQGMITVSLEKNNFTDEIEQSIETEKIKDSMNYPIFLIRKSTEKFLKYLNEIQDEILQKEKNLTKANNKDIEKMLNLQKSLLYFTTSLEGNKAILEKIENTHTLKLHELGFLKDTQIEIKQAIEMVTIYREILTNTMNTYNSIISNNMNTIMKFLTSVTLVISVPTMISSFLGMNVFLGDFGKNPYSFLLVFLLSLLISVLLILLLKKKNLL